MNPPGLRSKERNYVRSRASNLLAGDFTLELEFELEPREKDDWGNIAFYRDRNCRTSRI